jgi:hypothetical protein
MCRSGAQLFHELRDGAHLRPVDLSFGEDDSSATGVI